MPIELMKISRFRPVACMASTMARACGGMSPARLAYTTSCPCIAVAVQDIALDDRHPPRVWVLQSAGAAQIQGEMRISAVEKKRRGVPRELAVGTEDEDADHGFLLAATIIGLP